MRTRQARKKFFKRLVFNRKNVAIGAGITLLVLVLIPVFTYFFFSRDLGSKESIMNRNNTGVTLLDKDEKPFFTFYEAKITDYVEIDEIPDHTEAALVAAEDKDFYEHDGFSIKAIVAALWADIVNQDLAYGGSTITQQLVKNTLLSNEKSFLRKYQEIVLATEIDRRYSKDEILEMYLNSAYFGEGAFGIKAAAKTYYGKSVDDLTLEESAVLIGILPAPSAYSPINGNKQYATERRDYVLGEMLQDSKITQAEHDKGVSSEIKVKKTVVNSNLKAPHFALMVKDELIKRYGEEKITRSGFKVKTGLDPTWQKQAEEALKNRVEALAGSNVTNGSVVVQDPVSGEIRALVGSRGWSYPKFGTVNMANTKRQTGSSFKPLYFAGAIDDEVVTAADTLHDEPTDFGGYKPQNYDRRFRGNVTVRRALANSLNIPAVELMEEYGTQNALDIAEDFGITTLDENQNYGLSLALGTGEVPLIQMTNAYSTLAREGVQKDPVLITSIENKNGDDVDIEQDDERRTLSEEAAFIMSSIMSDKNARREIFGSLLDTPFTAAVKTGSTENYKDSWTIGYTPDLTVGVWIGNNDNQAMNNVAGSVGAAPVWRELMTEFNEDASVKFIEPDGVVKRSVCTAGGASAGSEYFIAGTQPDQECKPKKKPKEEKKKEDDIIIEETEEPLEEDPENPDDEEPLPDNEEPLPGGENPGNGNQGAVNPGRITG